MSSRDGTYSDITEQIAILCFNVASLAVKLRHPQAIDDAIGLLAGIESDAAVAGTVSEIEIAKQVIGIVHSRHDVLGLRFEFLQANDACALFPQPVQDPFIDGRADAV